MSLQGKWCGLLLLAGSDRLDYRPRGLSLVGPALLFSNFNSSTWRSRLRAAASREHQAPGMATSESLGPGGPYVGGMPSSVHFCTSCSWGLQTMFTVIVLAASDTLCPLTGTARFLETDGQAQLCYPPIHCGSPSLSRRLHENGLAPSGAPTAPALGGLPGAEFITSSCCHPS